MCLYDNENPNFHWTTPQRTYLCGHLLRHRLKNLVRVSMGIYTCPLRFALPQAAYTQKDLVIFPLVVQGLSISLYVIFFNYSWQHPTSKVWKILTIVKERLWWYNKNVPRHNTLKSCEHMDLKKKRGKGEKKVLALNSSIQRTEY